MTRHEGPRIRLDVGMPALDHRNRRHAIKARPMGVGARWRDPTGVEIVGGGASSMRRSVIYGVITIIRWPGMTSIQFHIALPRRPPPTIKCRRIFQDFPSRRTPAGPTSLLPLNSNATSS